MIKVTHRARLDQYWSALIGCQPDALQGSESIVVSTSSFSGIIAVKKNAWIIGISSVLGLNAVEELLDILNLADHSPVEAEQLAARYLAPIGRFRIVGPSSLFYLSEPCSDHPVKFIYPTRVLTVHDEFLLRNFLTMLGDKREYHLRDKTAFPIMIGAFHDNKLIAVGSVRVWDGFIGELFLDTLPAYSGQGLGENIGRMLLAWIFEQEEEMVAQFDTEMSNLSSLRVAQKLGFEFYGNLFVADLG